MHALLNGVRWFNQFSGVILLAVLYALLVVIANLKELVGHLECLHNDFDQVNSAHNQKEWAQQVQMDSHIEAIAKEKDRGRIAAK